MIMSTDEPMELPEPEPDPVEAAVQRLADRVEELARLHRHTAALNDRLYDDNKALRGGELEAAQAPLLRDLLRLHDHVVRLAEHASDPADLRLVEGQLVELLARQGIARELPEPGTAFDATHHAGVGRAPTHDPALAGTVAAVRTAGFSRDDGRLLRAAEVEVHIHVPERSSSPKGGSAPMEHAHDETGD